MDKPPCVPVKGTSACPQASSVDKPAPAQNIVQKKPYLYYETTHKFRLPSINLTRQPANVPVVSLINIDGARQSLTKGDGRPTVVNLWATWCPPCQAEMPILAEAQAETPGLHIVFVNQGETRDVVSSYLTSHDLHIKNALLDPNLAVARAVSATAYPTTLFYDAQGRLLSAHLGQFSRATFAQAIEQFYPDIELKDFQ